MEEVISKIGQNLHSVAFGQKAILNVHLIPHIPEPLGYRGNILSCCGPSVARQALDTAMHRWLFSVLAELG